MFKETKNEAAYFNDEVSIKPIVSQQSQISSPKMQECTQAPGDNQLKPGHTVATFSGEYARS